MEEILLFSLLGLGTGALIAGIGLGVVLSYRGSGVVNLATGAYAMVAGYLFHALRELPVAPALVLALGGRMLAVRSNERAAAAAGVSVWRTKFAAAALSSAIAGVGGVLYAYALGSVSLDRFGSAVALEALAFAYVGGISVVSGAVLGGLMTEDGLVPHALEVGLGLSGAWTLLIAGVLLVAILLLLPDGIAGRLRRRA